MRVSVEAGHRGESDGGGDESGSGGRSERVKEELL